MDNNEELLKGIFVKSYSSLVNTAYKLLNNREAAEDIVQDVFAKLLEKKNALSHIDNYSFYFNKMVVNNCLNYLKRSSRMHLVSDYSNFNLSVFQTRNDILFNELEERLNRATGTLPPKCKAIFCLSRLDGMSNQEIAEMLSISKRTVESQLFTALSKLREELSAYLYLLEGAGILMLIIFLINLLI